MAKSNTRRLGKFVLNARADAPDFRDFIYEPALVNLKPSLPAPENLNIRHQGSTNACTGFALAAVIDRLITECQRVSDELPVTVSARMLYEMAQRYDEWPGDETGPDEGSSCRGAIKGWYNMGVCRESLYSYRQKSSTGYTIEAAKDARNYTIGAYYRLGKRISDYHAALTEVGVIYCSAEVHKGWNSPNKRTGLISYDKNRVGGHAFAIIGYDDHGFWVQNSWGKSWGKNGTALWTYEDWLLNVGDAWVFRMALPTPQIWHLPARGGANTSAIEKSPSPARAEIAGHFMHVDDGQFHTTGRYWSSLDDVRMTAKLVAESDKYDHVLFYAHGGLNSPEDSARRIAAMKETFKANKVYPFHFMYDTGLLEELKDVLLGHSKKAEARAGGVTDWLDRILEKTLRVPGRALWREMKFGAESPFREKHAGSETLAAFIEAFSTASKPKKIHLLGHSTGMILLAHLVNRLKLLSHGLSVETVSLLAPAGTVQLFTDQMQPYLRASHPGFRISEMTIYNLNDDLEQDDNVTMAYNKSLLYLVSRSFEEDIPEKILGLQKYSRIVELRKNLSRLTIHYSNGDLPGARVTSSESHHAFDNDPLTMNHVLRRILGEQPVVEFTRESLDY